MMSLKRIKWQPVWFDSLGAKSMCTLVETNDVCVLIDPGAAEMQPGFPAPEERKAAWLREARTAIKTAAQRADVVIITHYHYDHFTDFDKELYSGKTLLAKNPNEYINDSQRGRALDFYDNISKSFGSIDLNEIMREPEEKEYPDPLEDLPIAMKRKYGDYAKRKKELISKGKKWFEGRVKKWNSYKRIPEMEFKECKVIFADSKKFKFGNTNVEFTKPLFHGIEFSRTGWVLSVVISSGSEKLLYTSDLQGPTIEDYAHWILEEDPNVLILDGPSTYLIPYMMNLINLQRCIENAITIIEETTKLELVIYDHHLVRERKYKERVQVVYKRAEKRGIKVLTVAEYLGKVPAVLMEQS